MKKLLKSLLIFLIGISITNFALSAYAGETFTDEDLQAFLNPKSKTPAAPPESSEDVDIQETVVDAGDAKVESVKKDALSADQLVSEYKDNPIAADARYKDKVIVVEGTIANIGREIMGKPYVVIGGIGLLDGVQCVFPKEEETSIMRLTKGQQVTIKGKVSGKLGNVLLTKCKLQ